MAGEVRRLKFLEGLTVASPSSVAASGIERAAIVNLSPGDSSKTVTFSSALSDANYILVCSIICDDSNPIFLNLIVYNKTVNGFSVKLNAQVDSNNYKLAYQVSVAR